MSHHPPVPPLNLRHITPILNVSDLHASFAWFEAIGFRKCWDWGTPPTFGSVGAGAFEIFLCLNAQGGRGRGPNHSTSGGPGQDETMDKGVWMSLWVDDVDAAFARCRDAGLDITMPPTDQPWGIREMHLRHPDGHVFRVSQSPAQRSA
jgi:predicted lactoylglutathione lyase